MKEKYTDSITDFSTEKVENRVENVYNSGQKPLISWVFQRGKLFNSFVEYTKGCEIFTKC